jgi:hypothetical protein
LKQGTIVVEFLGEREFMARLAAKVFLIGISLAVVLALTGCSGGSSSPSSSFSTGTTGSTGGSGTTGTGTGSGNAVINPEFFAMTVNLGMVKWPSQYGISIGTAGKSPGTGWAYIEKSAGQYTWSGLDNAINTAHSNGVTSIIYTFYGVPSFYTTDSAGCITQQVLVCPGPAQNTQDFINFVTALVTRYKGQITYYEMWNEGNRTTSWSGTAADLAQLQQTTYQTIKSIDSSAKMLTASPAIASDFATFVQQYLGAVQSGGTVYTDGVAWHGYHCANGESGDACLAGTSCDNNAVDCAGAPLEAEIQQIRDAETATGISLPIYDTEGGWQQNDDIGANTDDQSAYITRWYIIQASEGIKIACWYGFGTGNNPATDPTGWGGIINAPTQALTPAASAYQTAYNWINGATMTGACAGDSNNVWTCPLTFSNNNTGLIVWNGNETSTTYTPASQYGQYETLTTTSPTTIPGGGTVSIGELPILLESGNRP